MAKVIEGLYYAESHEYVRVEGEFGYVDTILTIASAMVFMKVIEDSGGLDALSSLIIEKFHKVPALMLCMIMVIIMFPGMITGSSTARFFSEGITMPASREYFRSLQVSLAPQVKQFSS